MCNCPSVLVDRRATVKARAHHGARSLDLTIPSNLRHELGLEPGDVFLVAATKKEGKITLTYTRIFPED